MYNIGSLGAENGLCLRLPEKQELAQTIGLLDKPYFMVVFHPETLNHYSVIDQVNTLLAALDNFKDDYDFIFIGSNSDTHSDKIFLRIQEYAQENQFRFFTSVTPENYLALIKYSQGIIGNSSSGLLEAPSFHVGTINIGNRQQGRVRGESVIDVPINTSSIIFAINQLLSADFQLRLPEMSNPYYQNNTMEQAYWVIKQFLDNGLKDIEPKSFFDLRI